MTRNPFEDVEELFDRMESQFEGRAGIGATGSVAVDVLDEDDEFVVKASLAGYDADDVDVTYADGRVRLSAERSERSDADYVRRERTSSVERSIQLPEAVDPDGIGATFEDGVLTIRLPKEDPEDTGKRIEIE